MSIVVPDIGDESGFLTNKQRKKLGLKMLPASVEAKRKRKPRKKKLSTPGMSQSTQREFERRAREQDKKK